MGDCFSVLLLSLMALQLALVDQIPLQPCLSHDSNYMPTRYDCWCLMSHLGSLFARIIAEPSSVCDLGIKAVHSSCTLKHQVSARIYQLLKLKVGGKFETYCLMRCGYPFSNGRKIACISWQAICEVEADPLTRQLNTRAVTYKIFFLSTRG